MQPHADNLTRRILLTLSMCFLLLVCTGCQVQDVTPEWWNSLPGGFLGWKEPLTRVFVLLIPWAIILGIFVGFVSIMNESEGCLSGFLVSVLGPYFAILALALLSIIFLSTFSYGLTGQIYYVTYPFACFCAGCLLFEISTIFSFGDQ